MTLLYKEAGDLVGEVIGRMFTAPTDPTTFENAVYVVEKKNTNSMPELPVSYIPTIEVP